MGGWWVCVVSIGKAVENGVVMVCERTNGRCELRNSMRPDKLGNIRMFYAHEERSLYGTQLQIGPTF
jgi:hypothetical protein